VDRAQTLKQYRDSSVTKVDTVTSGHRHRRLHNITAVTVRGYDSHSSGMVARRVLRWLGAFGGVAAKGEDGGEDDGPAVINNQRLRRLTYGALAANYCRLKSV
jgi:hypothetical protein